MNWAPSYDFPPASSDSAALPSFAPHQSSRGAPDVTTRLDNLRNLLNSERHSNNAEERSRALTLVDRESLEAAAASTSERIRRSRRGLESQARNHETLLTVDPDTIPAGHNNSPIRVRRTATRPSERMERHRESLSQNLIDRARAGLDHNANFEPDTLFPFPGPPLPRIASPDVTTREYSAEVQGNMEDRGRAKRQKLSVDHLSDGRKTANYGHRGQVVSGSLKMEMVSCDGRRYSESDGPSSWQGNLLQDDSSVYCTKRDRCNVILRHQKGIPFSLRKLVIKAPKNGLDASIQEGMIFVSSDDNSLLARTARYHMQYSPRPRPSSRHHEFSQIRLQPSHEYFHSTRSPLRSLGRSAYLQSPYPPQQPPHSTGTQAATRSGRNSLQDARNPPQPIPGFYVTTRFDDFDSESEDATDPRSAAIPNLREELATDDEDDELEGEDEDEDEDEEGHGDEDEGEAESHEEFLSLLGADPSAMSRARMTEYPRWRNQSRLSRLPSRIEVTPDLLAGLARSSTSPEVLAPHARFFIRRQKSSVSVRFDPPVAGKFILIKLWARSQDSNIDIQSIIAHGFAGPRYFPSLDFQ